MPLHQSLRPPAVGSCGNCRLRRSSSAWTPVTSSRLGTSTSGRCPVDAWCHSSHDVATAEVSADPAGSFSTPANAGLRAVLRHMTVMRLPFVVAEATTLDIATPQVVRSRPRRARGPRPVRDRLRLVREGLVASGTSRSTRFAWPSRSTPAMAAANPPVSLVAKASSVRTASKPRNSSIRPIGRQLLVRARCTSASAGPGDWCGGRQPWSTSRLAAVFTARAE
jgi:hypothetical protein